MKVGMLWLDADSKRTIEEKVIRAAVYYHDKYGHAPDLCLVNPTTFADEEITVGEVKVQRAKNVLPHHFWIGVSAN